MAKLDITNVRLLADHDTPIEMRDGTVLRADVYRRADGGRDRYRGDFVAGQTIYHDGEHQSFISLPVIPR